MHLAAFLNGSDHAEKANLQKMKVNAMKIRKVCADRNKLHTGKEWRPNAQAVVVRQVGGWTGGQAKNACSLQNFCNLTTFILKLVLAD